LAQARTEQELWISVASAILGTLLEYFLQGKSIQL